MQKQSPRGVLPEEGVMRMCCEFFGLYLCVGMILIKLQSGFVEIMLLHYCSLVGLCHVCRASFLEKTSRRLILCTIFNLYWFFLINYTFEDFKVSILINFNWFLLIAVLVFVRCFLRFLLYWRSFCKESEIFYSKIDYRDV